ncbi:MAG: hypothetical protein OEN01_03840 [Candidatus Krumholzibacteria bacterium]|nr:hypothetical protein [Candidatus Krumholzibacteria bacterium]
MEIAIIAAFTLIGVYLVIHPILTKNKYCAEFEDIFAFGDSRQLDYLNSKKALVLENIKELDFEYDMGKLSDEDYTALRHDYLKEAQETVQAIDKLKVREEIEELIESEVRSRRRIQ